MEKVKSITLTSNTHLRSELIPGFNSSWDDIFEFGLSYDGLQLFGDAAKLRMFAVNSLESFQEYGFVRKYNLDELRAIIFYFVKCFELENTPPAGKQLHYIHLILERIRQQLG